MFNILLVSVPTVCNESEQRVPNSKRQPYRLKTVRVPRGMEERNFGTLRPSTNQMVKMPFVLMI